MHGALSTAKFSQNVTWRKPTSKDFLSCDVLQHMQYPHKRANGSGLLYQKNSRLGPEALSTPRCV